MAPQDRRAYSDTASPTSSHQPYSSTPSPTISSLSGSSAVSSTRSALLTVLKPDTPQAKTSNCVSHESPPPEWQTAMAAMSSTIKDTMNLFTAYLKNNPPARSTQHANHRSSKKNADRRRKRRDRSQIQSKESKVEMPTTNPATPTGRGPQPKSQARTKNPHSHLGHMGKGTQPRVKTPEEEAQ